MTNGVTSRTENLTRWHENHRGEIELEAVARVYLGDAEITDRDRIAFALRELRKRGYDVEARPVDWTKPMMICSVEDSMWMAFAEPRPSRMYRPSTSGSNDLHNDHNNDINNTGTGAN